MMDVVVEPLAIPPSDGDLDALAALLCDAVSDGASVSFLPPLDHARARAFWADAVVLPVRGVTLVARARGDIVGCVQLCPAWAPNQPHRAEIAKLLVHVGARRGGIGVRLMSAVEDHARGVGFRLLTLDTQSGGSADVLYRRLGWTAAGEIPEYALDAERRAVATTIFYKRLG